jgi:hypothetical protein
MQERTVGRNANQRDKPRPRLQRTLRSMPSGPSRGPEPSHPRQHPSQEPKSVVPQATFTPQETLNPPEIQYQCTSCDMMVNASDAYCPFCGAIFADGPLSPEEEFAEAEAEEGHEEVEHEREPFVRPQKFDNLSMLKQKAKSRDLLYLEAMKGFTGSARLLEEIELLITDVSALGSDTAQARRLMSNAWEACREGDWPLVSALAKQTEDMMSPSIPDLVRMELGKARNMIVEAKSWGAETSRYMLTMKSAMSALHKEDLNEALRLTKELLDSLREDSATWKSDVKHGAEGFR